MENLVQAIVEIVRENPCQVGRVYTRLLRTKGFPNISKHEVNSILYGRRDLFKADINENYIPSWRVIETRPNTTQSRQKEPVKDQSVVNKEVKVKKVTVIKENDAFIWDPRFNLYQWQSRALNAWQDNGYQGIIEAVTGSGKTRLALAAIDAHLGKGYKVLIIVPNKDLMNQWSENVKNSFPTYQIGYLGDGSRQSLRYVDILIGISNSVQKYKTLSTGMRAFIIADEVHHYGTALSKKMLESGYSRRLGLTASLERGDNGVDRIIEPYFGKTVYSYEYSEAIDDQVIAPFKILFLSVPMSVSEETEYSKISTRISKLKSTIERKYPEIMNSPNGTYIQRINRLPFLDKDVKLYKTTTYSRSQMVVRMKSKFSVVRHLSSIIKKSNGSFVFTQLTENNNAVAEVLRKNGVKIVEMDGSFLPEQRRSILRSFKDRDIQAIAAPKLLDEGIDVPHADLAIITGKSNSKRQLIQRLGRVVRRKLDNGMGRIVILISKGTTEDPDVYDSDAFYEVFTGADIEIERFEIENDSKKLEKFLEEWST